MSGQRLPEPFLLERGQDPTGVSGTGFVAEGVRFSDGTVVLRWHGLHASTAVWDSVEDAMFVHGHDGKTRIVWHPVAAFDEDNRRKLPSLLQRKDCCALIGQNIAHYRSLNRWSQAELARRWGEVLSHRVDPTTVTRLERGKRPISVDELMVIAAVLGVRRWEDLVRTPEDAA